MAKEKRYERRNTMSEEKELFNWCCLQTLYFKAGLLSDEQIEKLKSLDPNIFEHYMDEIKENMDRIELVLKEK